MHTFGKIWEERGYLNSKGKDLIHKELIKSVLDSVFKPLETAVVHIKGHQKLTTLEGKGNQIADQAAKEAVSDRSKPIRVLKLRDISNNKGRKVEQVFSEKELKAIEEL